MDRLFVHIIKRTLKTLHIQTLSLDKEVWYLLPGRFQDIKIHPVLSSNNVIKNSLFIYKTN